MYNWLETSFVLRQESPFIKVIVLPHMSYHGVMKEVVEEYIVKLESFRLEYSENNGSL